MADSVRRSEDHQLNSQSKAAGRPPGVSMPSVVTRAHHPLYAQGDRPMLDRHWKQPRNLERMDYMYGHGHPSLPDSSIEANDSHLVLEDPVLFNLPRPDVSPTLSEVPLYTTRHSMWRSQYSQSIIGNETSSRQLESVPSEVQQDTLNYGLHDSWRFDGLLYPWTLAYGNGLDHMSQARPRSFQAETPLLVHQNVVLASEAHPPASYLKDPNQLDSYMPTPQLSEDGSQFESERGALYRSQIGNHSPDLGEPYPPSLSRISTRSPLDCEDVSRGFTPSSLLTFDSVDATRMSESESDGEENGADEPYAKLIHRALLSAPGHRMVLKQIYDWFERHTDKPNQKNGSDKGWQNSIRHNLSMNGVSPVPLSWKREANLC
jgi:hypothetical protein